MIATETVKPHSSTIDGRVITLVDTPGFNDTFRGDAEVLAGVAKWLANLYHSRQRLTGLIYMHPITEPRITGSMLKNLRVFEKMLGEGGSSNMILVTSKWDLLASIDEGLPRERELCQGIWAPLIERGSRTLRFAGNKSSAMAIVNYMLNYYVLREPYLQIQREMAAGLPLDETAAGSELRQELLKIQHKYEAEIAKLRQDDQQGAVTMRQEVEDVRVELALLKHGLSSKDERQDVEARIRSNWGQRSETLRNPKAQIKIRDLRDAPPPYGDHVGRWTVESWQRFLTLATWVRREISRAMRPRLQDGRTRLEWTCVSLKNHQNSRL